MSKHLQKSSIFLLAAITIAIATTTYNPQPTIGATSTQQKQDLSQDRVGRVIEGGQITPTPVLTQQQANQLLHDF